MRLDASPLERLAPAKINLALHVTGRRDDGYHLLESLVVFARFGDRVSLLPSGEAALQAAGPYQSDVPLDASNLILRARDLLRDHLGDRDLPPVAFALEKNLPVASGIGGGSSDAAAALILLRRYWNLDLSLEELAGLALPLGADIPMCIAATPLIARGTGERIEPVELPTLPLVLVNPGVQLATPSVFRALGNRNNDPLPPVPKLDEVKDVVAWLTQCRNDLEAPAISLAPEIAATLEALRLQEAAVARMSGSGATCFGIFATEEDARKAARTIATQHPAWFVVATRTLASDEVVS